LTKSAKLNSKFFTQSGAIIPFVSKPKTQIIRTGPESQLRLPPEKAKLVNELIESRILAKIPPNAQTQCFVSPSFFVRKKENGWRLITNFQVLNRHIAKFSYQLRTVKNLKEMMGAADRAFTIDLTKAFFQVQMDQKFRKYLVTQIGGVHVQYLCLPMGLSVSPFLLHLALKPLKSNLTRNNIQHLTHVDDFLILCNRNEESTVRNVLSIFESHGAQLSRSKSHLEPKDEVKFCGIRIDLQNRTISNTKDKVRNARNRIRSIIRNKPKAIKKIFFASVLGKVQYLSSCAPWITPYLSTMFRYLNSAKGWSWKTQIKTSEPFFDSLIELYRIMLIDKPLHTSTPTNKIIIYSDACSTLGGATIYNLNEKRSFVFECRVPKEMKASVETETLTALKSIQAAASTTKQRTHFLLNTDNMTTKFAIQKRKSANARIMMMIKKWMIPILLEDHTVTTTYIAGKKNQVADTISRIDRRSGSLADATLTDKARRRIEDHFGKLNRDLFPISPTIDAFTKQWKNMDLIFPPPGIIQKTIAHLNQHRNRIEVIMIAPIWITQPWILNLFEQSTDHEPLILNNNEIESSNGSTKWNWISIKLRNRKSWQRRKQLTKFIRERILLNGLNLQEIVTPKSGMNTESSRSQ